MGRNVINIAIHVDTFCIDTTCRLKRFVQPYGIRPTFYGISIGGGVFYFLFIVVLLVESSSSGKMIL